MKTAADISALIARSCERGSLIQEHCQRNLLTGQQFSLWVVSLEPYSPPRRGFPLHRCLDVLVVPEQIRGVVLPLQLHQTLVVGAVGCPDLVGAVFFLTPDVVDVDPASGVGP